MQWKAQNASPTLQKQAAGSSLLWAGHVNQKQRETASQFALALLKLSSGTSEFRRIAALPREERLNELHRAQAARKVHTSSSMHI